MAEDTELALAYSNALKTATVPTLSIDGVFNPTTRMYLDSAALQHNLQVFQTSDHVYKRFEKHRFGEDVSHTSPFANSQEVFLPSFLP